MHGSRAWHCNECKSIFLFSWSLLFEKTVPVIAFGLSCECCMDCFLFLVTAWADCWARPSPAAHPEHRLHSALYPDANGNITCSLVWTVVLQQTISTIRVSPRLWGVHRFVFCPLWSKTTVVFCLCQCVDAHFRTEWNVGVNPDLWIENIISAYFLYFCYRLCL